LGYRKLNGVADADRRFDGAIGQLDAEGVEVDVADALE